MDLSARIEAIASLAEPSRRALYLYVYAQGTPVSRDEAAAGVGVPRHTAKFHLDKLAADGLLEVGFARRSGRRGPGAGRPAKLYRPAAREVAVTLPERRYELAAQLMARAIADARGGASSAADTLRAAARGRGHVIGDQAVAEAGDSPSEEALLAAARSVLDREGYDTRAGPDGLIFANCPFGPLTAVHTEVICGMNQSIMEGMLDQLGQLHLAAICEPAEGRCCIRLAANPAPVRDLPPDLPRT